MNTMLQRTLDYSQAVAKHIKEKFGQEISVRVDNKDTEDEMVLIDNWIDIRSTQIDKRTIRGVEAYTGLVVEVAVVQHNYPHEPDDVDISEVGTFDWPRPAVLRAFGIWFESYVERAIENCDVDRIIEEEKDVNI